MEDKSPEIQVLIDNKNIAKSRIQEAYLDRVTPPIDVYETACKRLVIAELFRKGIQRDSVISFFSFLTKTILPFDDPYKELDKKHKERTEFNQTVDVVSQIITKIGTELLSQYRLLDPDQFHSILQARDSLLTTQLSYTNKDTIEEARFAYIQALINAQHTTQFIRDKGGNNLVMFISIILSGIPLLEELMKINPLKALVFYLSIIVHERTGCFKNIGQDSSQVDCGGFFKNPANAEYCDCGTAPLDMPMTTCDGNEDMVFCRSNCKNVYMKNCIFESDTKPIYYSFKQPSPYQIIADIIVVFYELHRIQDIKHSINFSLIFLIGLALFFIWVFLTRL